MFNDEALKKFLLEEKTTNEAKVDSFIKEYKKLPLAQKSDVVYELVGKKIYREKPVGINEFITSSDYLGPVYEGTIFPMWVQMLNEIYPAPFFKAYNEVILSCATRSGKSTLTVISFLYEMYLLMCMINPAKTLVGKANGTLVFAVLSVSNSLAIGSVCADIHKGLMLSPYFQEQVDNDLPFSTVDKKGVLIGSNILLKAGSNYGTVVGTDLICGCLDEANIASSRIAADELVNVRLEMYKAMLDRRKATYDKAPYMTGIMWLTSSPTDEFDVIGERIRQVKEANLQNVLIRDNIPRWEARCESMKNTFPLFLGSEFKDPCILDESDTILTLEEEHNVIQVPEKYRHNFRSDITFAIRDIAGRRTSGEQSLFKSASVFDKVFYKKNDIFTKDELRIDLDNMNTIEDYLIDKDYFSHPHKPKCYRYIHLDIASKKDRFGMSSVYSDMVEYVSAEGDRKYARKFYVDFCLGIVPMKGGTVDILRVLEFVYGLKQKGYPIKLVTTDSHQGELARQIIARHGVHTEYQSVEKDKNAYHNLKNLILTESLEGYKNYQLVNELRSLKETERKIEKRKGSTDDMSDSLAGACWSCLNDKYFRINDEDVLSMIDTLRYSSDFTGYNTFNY